FRRSRNRKYVCRSGSDRCSIGEGINCRKCRMRELERKLEGKPIGELLREQSAERNTDNAQPAFVRQSRTSPSSLGNSSPFAEDAKKTLILERLRQGYRSMCDSRITGELNARVPPIHPSDAVEGKYDILPATYRSIDAANRIFLTALLQFGSVVFPGFDGLTRDDKWTIVTNFFRRFRAFEAGYRAEKAFGREMQKTFAGFTSYFDGNMPANFFDGCPVIDAKEAKRVMEDKFNRDYHTSRMHLHTANLRHDEFLAVLALMFWSTDGLPINDDATHLSQTCREAVLKELHGYFRDELGLDDYAARLGALLMLLQ
ncbi:hypothetical protein PENTCL1PPCAC_15596, partial [Pristionchus entomophagus]